MGKLKGEEWEAVKIGSGGRIVVPQEYLTKKGLARGDIALLSLKKAKVEANEKGELKKDG